jgi:hypothetical protein
MSEVAVLTLSEFLMARIAEDEALWELAVDADLAFVAGPGRLKAVPPTDFSRRMLADAAAKRAIVEHYQWTVEVEGGGAENTAAHIIRVLAAVYADHDDYRDEWKP